MTTEFKFNDGLIFKLTMFMMFIVKRLFLVVAVCFSGLLVTGTYANQSDLNQEIKRKANVAVMNYDPVYLSETVNGMINGISVDMKLDTGSRLSSISSDLAHKLNLITKDGEIRHTLSGSFKDSYCYVDDFVPFTYFKEKNRKTSCLNSDAACYLGYDYILKSKSVVDFGAHEVYFFDSKNVDFSSVSMRNGFIKCNLKTSKTLATIDVKINGRIMRFIIDNGCECSYISYKALDDLKIKTPFYDSGVSSVDVTGSSVDDKMICFDSILIDGHKFINYPMLATKMSLPLFDDNVEICGILGADFLYATQSKIDCDGGCLYFKKDVDVRRFSLLPSRIFNADEDLKNNCTQSVWIGQIHLKNINVVVEDGALPLLVLKFNVIKVYKGRSYAQGDLMTGKMRLNCGDYDVLNYAVNLTKTRPGSRGKIIFVKSIDEKSGEFEIMPNALWNYGDIVDKQLQGIDYSK